MMELTPQQVFSRLAEAQIVDVRATPELHDGMLEWTAQRLPTVLPAQP
ncbi:MULTISPECIES: hypothetical protein [Cryobacterium]|nr:MULTISPECIES: hypothetical protein [Cryobacterium]